MCKLLFEKLTECGVAAELLLVEGGGHCYEKMNSEIEPSPSLCEIQNRIANFVRKKIQGGSY